MELDPHASARRSSLQLRRLEHAACLDPKSQQTKKLVFFYNNLFVVVKTAVCCLQAKVWPGWPFAQILVHHSRPSRPKVGRGYGSGRWGVQAAEVGELRAIPGDGGAWSGKPSSAGFFHWTSILLSNAWVGNTSLLFSVGHCFHL